MTVDLAEERLTRLKEAMQLPVDGETSEERASQILVRTIAIREARTWTPPENYKAKREYISGGDLYLPSHRGPTRRRKALS